MGADDAKAPMAMWGYFNLNHAASTAHSHKPTINLYVMIKGKNGLKIIV